MTRTVTSASNFFRRVHCKASARVEKDLPEVPSPWAERGALMHDLWAHPEKSRAVLTDDELSQLDKVELADMQFRESIFGPEIDYETFVETPVVLFSGGKHEMRSTPDRYYLHRRLKIIAVPDAKFGRIEVDEAADNWQLVVYLASLAAQFQDVEMFYGIVLQPWAKKTAPVVYTRSEIWAMVMQLGEVLQECEDNPYHFHPSPDNCRYCKGALHGVCQANREFALQTVQSPDVVNAAIRHPVGFLMSLEPSKRAQFLDALKMTETLGKAVRPAAREILATNKEAIPGWKLGKESEMRKITDVGGLCSVFRNELGLSQDELVESMSMSLEAAEAFIKKATNLKGEELKSKCKAVLKPFCDVTPKERSLERE